MLNVKLKDMPVSAGSEPLEASMYPARLVGLYDIGDHSSQWGNKRQMVAMFELPTEASEDEDGTIRPRLLSTFYNLLPYFSAKAKVNELTDSLGLKQSETYADLLGRACQIDVIAKTNDGKTVNRIASVSKLGKGMDVAEPMSTLTVVSEESWGNLDNIDMPDWIKEKIGERIQ